MGLPDQEPAGVSNFFDSDAVTSYELDDSLLEEASKVVAENHEAIPEFWREKYSRESVKSWDVFYKRNGSRFFKDRQWTGKEFAELSGHSAAEPCCAGDSSAASSAAESGGPLPEATAQKPPEECEQFFTRGLGEDFEPQGPPPPHAEPPTRPAQLPAAQGRATQLLVDCGSGVGNALLPMLKRNPNLRGIAFDCSERAILLLQERFTSEVEAGEGGLQSSQLVRAVPFDITAGDVPASVCDEGTADFALLLFVLSAVAPQFHAAVAQRVAKLLRPGGLLFFRDYGRYDMAQLRFANSGKCKMEENFYVRYDGTFAYYFTSEEVEQLFGLASSAGLEAVENRYCLRQFSNRKTLVRMRRVWVQAKYRKPRPPGTE
eukprot:GHVT01007098.1.p1 GENE.GHVT01007098.1~~GHVT01007098.1.p1  ORF type:complete len:375 (+),score=87.03 GHVT01007098.1:214-1338(+)